MRFKSRNRQNVSISKARGVGMLQQLSSSMLGMPQEFPIPARTCKDTNQVAAGKWCTPNTVQSTQLKYNQTTTSTTCGAALTCPNNLAQYTAAEQYVVLQICITQFAGACTCAPPIKRMKCFNTATSICILVLLLTSWLIPSP
jgi:hypothetical protein